MAVEIRVNAGFCIQTDSLGTPAGRWYLNMCRHKMVEMPVAYSGRPVSREYILSHGIGSMSVPFDMGSFRKLKARADGAKHTAYAVDIVFNPFIIQMFMDDEFNATMTEYRPFIINLALQRIESSIGVKLATNKVKLVKQFVYKDGEGNSGQTPKEFTELPDELETVEEVPTSRKPTPPEEPVESLIQDVTPGRRKKPAMKKGFLNNASTSLYPPEGSKEGVVPENAGDPMGYLPKGLRKNCKIVDTNAPEYQKGEEQRKSAENQNKAASEFNDMLKQDLSHWSKDQSLWDQEDRPEGKDTPVMQKYETDYSRFDKLDVDEDKPQVESRDWYSDANGKVHSLAPAKTGKTEATDLSREQYVEKAASSSTGSGPTMKKGFLDSAKNPLYPKGSEQRAPTDEAPAALLESMGKDPELMKSFENLMSKDSKDLGDEDALIKQFGKLMSDSQQQTQAPTAAAKLPTRKAPDFTLDPIDAEGLLQLVVAVPGLESMQGVDLDVTETCASIAFPSSVGLAPLKVDLPKAVIPTGVKAKFSKKTRQLIVKLPLFLQVAKAG